MYHVRCILPINVYYDINISTYFYGIVGNGICFVEKLFPFTKLLGLAGEGVGIRFWWNGLLAHEIIHVMIILHRLICLQIKPSMIILHRLLCLQIKPTMITWRVEGEKFRLKHVLSAMVDSGSTPTKACKYKL